MKIINNHNAKLIALLHLSLLLTFNATAQESYLLAENTEVSIEGASTLHSWKAVVNHVEGELQPNSKFAKMKLKDGGDVGTVNLKFKVATIDGGRGDTMNDKIKNALKVESSPHIEFIASQPATITTITDKDKNIFLVLAKGNLSIAGVTKLVAITLEGKFVDKNTLKFTGEQEMKMSDFEIEQPSAMFGTIVASDDIKINFNLIFSNTTNKS